MTLIPNEGFEAPEGLYGLIERHFRDPLTAESSIFPNVFLSLPETFVSAILISKWTCSISQVTSGGEMRNLSSA